MPFGRTRGGPSGPRTHRALVKERLDLDLRKVGIRVIPKNDSVAFAYQSAKLTCW